MFTKVCIIANILQFEPIENIEPYLEDLDENNCDNCKQKVIIYAAKHKYMKALDYLNFVQYDYLLNSYYHCIQESINYAAANGHVDVLEWFHNSIFDFEYNSDTIDNAAANGHVNVLEWFKNSNYEFIYNNAISYAAQFEHLNVLEWFHNSGYPFKYNGHKILQMSPISDWFPKHGYNLHDKL